MKKMSFYPTITELINQIKTKDISYRNLHENIYIRQKNQEGETSTITIPYKSVIRDYLDVFRDDVITVQLDDFDIARYRFKPKRMSNDLYGTPELWSAILELNGCVSLIDFNLERPLKVFNPNTFKSRLNEIMILEEILV